MFASCSLAAELTCSWRFTSCRPFINFPFTENKNRVFRVSYQWVFVADYRWRHHHHHHRQTESGINAVHETREMERKQLTFCLCSTRRLRVWVLFVIGVWDGSGRSLTHACIYQFSYRLPMRDSARCPKSSEGCGSIQIDSDHHKVPIYLWIYLAVCRWFKSIRRFLHASDTCIDYFTIYARSTYILRCAGLKLHNFEIPTFLFLTFYLKHFVW